MKYLLIILFLIFSQISIADNTHSNKLVINNPTTTAFTVILYHNRMGEWERVDRIHIPAGHSMFYDIGWGFCSDYGFKKAYNGQKFVMPFSTCELTIF